MNPRGADTAFSSFARRLTRGYVVVAFVLILIVAGTSTVLAFFLYARVLNDAVTDGLQRAVSETSAYQERHIPLQTSAQKIADDIARLHLQITVSDTSGKNLASNRTRAERSEVQGFGFRLAWVFGLLFGLRPEFAHVVGGTIAIEPDWNAVRTMLAWYWAIVLPVSTIAVLAAWLLGRNITRRAMDPLVDVTTALHRIAGGDFQPEPLRRDSGELSGLIAAYNDVAFRLTTASNEREENALQMRRFIADAGHELRTPLTIIMGYLDVLLGGIVRDPNGIARIHETMQGEGRRMKTLVDKLILLARLDRPESSSIATSVDVNEITQRVVRGLDPIAGNRIELHLPAARSFVAADDTELAQAIGNVIQNALKYAPDSPVRVHVSASGKMSRIEITDRGPGMSEQDILHAFDRFYRGASRGAIEGSGLGLAIAKRAVERTGGTIALQSAIGEGTKITLELPVLAENAATSEEFQPEVPAR